MSWPHGKRLTPLLSSLTCPQLGIFLPRTTSKATPSWCPNSKLSGTTLIPRPKKWVYAFFEDSEQNWDHTRNMRLSVNRRSWPHILPRLQHLRCQMSRLARTYLNCQVHPPLVLAMQRTQNFVLVCQMGHMKKEGHFRWAQIIQMSSDRYNCFLYDNTWIK